MRRIVVGALAVLFLLSFTSLQEIEVFHTDKGTTFEKMFQTGEGEQVKSFFVPGDPEVLQGIMEKALEWKSLNESHKKAFVKEIEEVNVWSSANHYEMYSSTNYWNQASFEFEGRTDGGCRLIIKKTTNRHNRYMTFHVVEGRDLEAFSKLFHVDTECAADAVFH